jgi:hypothetical protein
MAFLANQIIIILTPVHHSAFTSSDHFKLRDPFAINYFPWELFWELPGLITLGSLGDY